MRRTDRSLGDGRIPAPRSRMGRKWAIGLLSVVLIGCGHPDEPFTRVAIDGTVLLDDRPLDSAVIRFVPTGTTSGPKTSFEVREGRFASGVHDGPPVGTHRVEIESIDPEWRHDDEEAVDRLRQSRSTKITRERLPDRYHIRSSLSATLTAPQPDADSGSSQTLEFHLSGRSR